MTELIEDLLAYAEAGRKARPFEEVDMREVVDAALSNLRQAAEARGARISVSGDMPRVPGDRPQLTQLVQNLVANALKFMPADRSPQVSIAVEPGDGEWLFSVRDNGIGIEENHLERIFEVYHRVRSRTSYPGTGVGLAICKRVVERHGGRIWVQSVPGEGSTFFFTLAAQAEEGQEAQ